MITIAALFTKNSGQPATGLTLAEINLYLYRRTKATGAIATVWNGLHPTEEIGGGLYSRTYSSEDMATYEYFAYAAYTGLTVLDTNYATQGASQFSDAAVWGYSPRTLTQSAAAVTAAVSGSTITILRGDSLSASLTGLGDISTRTKLWFTVKKNRSMTDAQAMLQIEETAGLVYLNGAAAGTPANGDITVTDAVAGDLTITLDEAETDDLVVGCGYYYDVQMLTAGGTVTTLTTGSCNVTADVTRAVA